MGAEREEEGGVAPWVTAPALRLPRVRYGGTPAKRRSYLKSCGVDLGPLRPPATAFDESQWSDMDQVRLLGGGESPGCGPEWAGVSPRSQWAFCRRAAPTPGDALERSCPCPLSLCSPQELDAIGFWDQTALSGVEVKVAA